MLTLTEQLADLRIQINALVKAGGSTLPEIYGVGPIVAATIIGHVSDVRRYATTSKSRNSWSGTTSTPPTEPHPSRPPRAHRTTPPEPRREPAAQRALYTIAIAQIRGDTEARAYYERIRSEAEPAAKPSAALKDGSQT